MATGTIMLEPGGAVTPDGSASNAAPQILRFQGTETSPKKHFLALAYDASTNEYAFWQIRMPSNYSSGLTLKIQWMANATANSVVWECQIAAVTPTDTDTPIEHAQATTNTSTTSVNTTEARRLVETSITLTNADSVAAGDWVNISIFRNAASGSDTCTVDAELIMAALEYTTS